MTDDKEGLYGNPTNLKAQNIRVLIITVITALLVLGITAWGIIYAIGSDNSDESANTDTETVEIATDGKTEEKTETKTEEKTEVKTEDKAKDEAADKTEEKTENVVEITNLDEDAATNESTAPKTDNIPKTGPEDILPLALVLGLLTAYIGSTKLAKAEV